MDLSRAKYILPNTFTLGSVLCATFSMHIAAHAESPERLALAAWLLLVSMLCDLVDGRVARLTRSQSEFGVQLDSLADAVSFGVAPAWLMYYWGLEPLGALGVVISFVYVGCTLMRLARFNVMAAQEDASAGPSKFFQGLPSPLAAGAAIAVVLTHISITGQMTTPASRSVGLFAILLGGLMVSNVRYHTFKGVNWRGRAGVVLAALAAATTAVGLAFEPSIAVVSLMFLYISLGLVGGVIHVGREILDQEDASGADESQQIVLRDEESR